MNAPKITADAIRAMKGREPVAALTAYDFAMARWLDATGVPLLLVGDSLGMVLLGYPDTTHVTMEDMEHHVRSAARAKPRALLAADLPFNSCPTVAAALENTRRLLDAGAEAVKAEGGRNILPQVRAIIEAGVPFLGHLGMLPQNAVAEGGYHIKGKTSEERSNLMADAEALAQAGAFAIVLELVTPPVARDISEKIPIPTIGIGSGPDCDGQILVTTDLLGTSPGPVPRHVKKHWHFAEQMGAAVVEWKEGLIRPGNDVIVKK
jgi:3-methyl-2-oxobutanoate hydroxymethyltransferase